MSSIKGKTSAVVGGSDGGSDMDKVTSEGHVWSEGLFFTCARRRSSRAATPYATETTTYF